MPGVFMFVCRVLCVLLSCGCWCFFVSGCLVLGLGCLELVSSEHRQLPVLRCSENHVKKLGSGLAGLGTHADLGNISIVFTIRIAMCLCKSAYLDTNLQGCVV